MANIKFSQFTQENAAANVDFIVGYVAATNTNVRIAPSQLGIGVYLPLTGGTMTGGGNVNFPDNFQLFLGNGNDLQIYHDATDSYISNTQNSGDLIIQNGANGKDVVFKCDDGAGGLTTYLKLDAASEATTFVKRAYFPDNIKAQFGNSSDLKIYHDGDHSYIQDTSGTGDLRIDTNVFRLRSANAGESMITAFEDNAVNLMFNSFTKLSTTNTGVEITGNLDSPSISINDYIVHNGDDNTFFGFPSADAISFTTAGTERMRITPAGYIGVGTSFPSSKIEVVQTGSGTDNTIITQDNARKIFIGRDSIKATDLSNNAQLLYIQQNGGGATFGGRVGIGIDASTNAMLDVQGPDTNNAVLARFFSNTGTRGSFIIRNGTSVSPTTFIGTAGGSEELSIGTNNTDAIRINGSGQVGIGLSNQNRVLEVKSTGGDQGISLVQSGTDYKIFQAVQTGSGDGALLITNGSGTQTALIRGAGNSYINGGNVGIGNNSPGAKLQVETTAALNTAIFENSGQTYSYAAIKVNEALNNKACLTFAVGDSLASTDIIGEISGLIASNGGALQGAITFKTNSGDNLTERMRIHSNGNVGIGNSTNINKLDVSGNINIQGGDASYLTFNNGDANITILTNGTGRDLTFKTYNPDAGNNAERMRLDKNGNLGIGTSSPLEKLHVDGNIRVNSGVQGYYGSFIQAISSSGLKVGNDSFSGYAFFNDNGNVGIGTESPTSKLEVAGEIEIAGAGNGILLASADGTKYRVTVTNAGALSVTAS